MQAYYHHLAGKEASVPTAFNQKMSFTVALGVGV
jgi:hypothetical protein